MKTFNVLQWDFNQDSLQHKDVLPYFRDALDQSKNAPATKSELKEFIERKSLQQFWSRCEYEMICHGWPPQKNEHKLDIHEQIMMNIDIITEILWNER